MEVQLAQLGNKGMFKDTSISKASNEFAYHNRSIRITAVGEESLLSVTNEKGPSQREVFIKTSTSTEPLREILSGAYIGHCVTPDYIILFVKRTVTIDEEEVEKDFIYRINDNRLEDDEFYVAEQLFTGDLGLSIEHPIETLFYYESEDVQKVYWIDGIHQTRVINIKKEDYVDDDNTAFDFVPVINNIPTVNITKEFNALGNFHSGTIQYFITYYNKFGAETAIVWSSSLYYISPENRAGAPDEFCSCSFNINISDLDDKFEYIRVYSAKRQSLDGPIEASVVKDISIKDRTSINIIDDGTNQASVDSNYLYFIGGDNIIPQTFAQKDDTLFLGNIKIGDSYDRDKFNTLKNEFNYYLESQYGEDIIESPWITFIYKEIDDANPTSFYPYKSQINNPSIDFKGFKAGEIYRFAIQFQDINGTWVDPIWIGDKKCNLHPYSEYTNNQRKIFIPTARYENGYDDIKDYIYECGFKQYRILMANTDYSTRSIVAQGIICPTMFNYDDRIHNKPYSMASYIMRPRGSNAEYRHFYPVQEICGNDFSRLPYSLVDNPLITVPSEDLGITCKFSFYNKIAREYPNYKVNFVISLYNLRDTTQTCDVYSFDVAVNPSQNGIAISYAIISGIIAKFGNDFKTILSFDDFKKLMNSIQSGTWTVDIADDITTCTKSISLGDNEYLYNFFLSLGNSDQLPSASGNFNNEFYVDESIVTFNSPDLLDNFNQINQSQLKFRLVGISPITSNKSAFRIEFDPNSSSNYRGTVLTVPNEYNITNITSGASTLIAESLYNGYLKDKTSRDNYTIFMWHKMGSITGDLTGSSETKLDNIDLLDNKLFATERFSLDTEYFDDYNINISDVILYNYDNIALEKINTVEGYIHYYGNYKKALAPLHTGYYIPHENIVDPIGTNSVKTLDPTIISFNSTPHAVFALNNDNNSRMALLPRLSSDQYNHDYVEYSFINNNDSTISNLESCYGIIYVDEESTPEAKKSAISAYIQNTTELNIPGLNGIVILTNQPPGEFHNPVYAVYRVQTRTGRQGQGIIIGISLIDEDTIDFNVVYQGNHSIDTSKSYTILNSTTISELSKTNHYTRLNDIDYSCDYPYLFIGELYRDIPYDELYGGYTDNDLEKISWIPISLSTAVINSASADIVNKMEGDTYYQRWDCVKTTPQSLSDTNQVIDITSVMLESHTCLDGRYDRNRVNADILNINTDNFNLFNQAYDQKNNIFQYNILDDKFDLDTFSNQIVWSNQKSKVDDIDTWTNISQISSIYLDGLYGPINKLVNFNDTIVAFQDKAISSVRFNNQIQVSTEHGLPIEVVNSGKVTGYDYLSKVNGCHNKWSIVEGSGGLYFIDDFNKAFFKFSKDGLVNVSLNCGFSKWFRDFITGEQWTLDSAAFRGSADRANHDIYLIKNTPDGCLCYSEDTQSFTSFYPYKEAVSIFNFKNRTMFLDNKLKIYHMFEGDYLRDFSVEYNVNPEPLIDKTFTNIEYTADTRDGAILHRENPFKLLLASTEYQSGKVNLLNNSYPNGEKKFRIWRADIPRDSANKLDRLRNTWMRLKLIGNSNIDGVTTLHNLVVKYFK